MTVQDQLAADHPVASQLAIHTVRIQAGVAWLDHHYPSWRQRISVLELNLASPCRCILGQTYQSQTKRINPRADGDHYDSGYEYAIVKKLTHAEAEAYGFTAAAGDEDDGFELLTRLWCQELTTPGSVAP